MNDKTLIQAYCSIERLRVSQFDTSGQSVLSLKVDTTQLDMDVEIDFDTSTTFTLTIWNLRSDREIIKDDQLKITLWWEGYSNASDSLIVSGIVTECSRKSDKADMRYTIKGDIVGDWNLTYLEPQPVPSLLFSTEQLLRMIRHAGIASIKSPITKFTLPILVKKQNIRDLLNTIVSTFGTDYTWMILNDNLYFYKKGECVSDSLNVIDLNNSDVIEYEIEDSRMRLKTFGLPELDNGSIFKYDGVVYFVDTIKHSFTHNGGYLCDIYAEVKSGT